MKAYAVLWLFIYFLVYTNLDAMATFFFATLTFNLAVLTILVIGIIVIMRSSITLVMLAGTFGILAYKKENLSFYLQGIEKIMPANIAHMFNSRAEKGVLLFTSEESRSVIEWIDEKFSNQNRYINYFIGTSLMIGLLGTFTGLLVSIDQMGKIILSLTGDIDLGAVIGSFSGPLSGMAIGFGSSLFGVVSAIILGLMGYILNKNQESLIEGVEDWLKGRIIDSGGVAPATVMTGNGEALPEQRSSFLDVFIDNISALTKEMAKISVTNERLHTITIASVQQTRDEHEVNYELFEAMSKSLISIDSNSKEHALRIQERLSGIESVILTSQASSIEVLKESIERLSSSLLEAVASTTDKTQEQSRLLREILSNLDAKLQAQLELLSKMQLTQEEANAKVDESSNRLQELRLELQEIALILKESDASQRENLQEIFSALSTLAIRLQEEMQILSSLERLQNIQIEDAKEQAQTLRSLNANAQDAKELSEVANGLTQEANALTQETNTLTQTANALAQENISLAQETKSLTQESIKLSQTSNASISVISEKLQTLEALLATQAQNQDKSLLVQDESAELLKRHREILELIVGKNDESISELKRIASLQQSAEGFKATLQESPTQAKAPGFFSKLFK